jgi:hypothetical protein
LRLEDYFSLELLTKIMKGRLCKAQHPDSIHRICCTFFHAAIKQLVYPLGFQTWETRRAFWIEKLS